jgi:uncharacterized protein YggE
MKRAFIPVLTVSLLFMAHSTLAQCPSARDRNLILTDGMAEVTGQNDSAKVSVAVVTQGRNLEQVTLENASKTKAVIQSVNGLNIKDLKLKTSDYRVTPQRDYKARPPKINGYEVHNAIEITLEGFETEPLSKNISMMIGKALESGCNNINQIQFYIKNASLKTINSGSHGSGENSGRGSGREVKTHCFTQHPADSHTDPATYASSSRNEERSLRSTAD